MKKLIAVAALAAAFSTAHASGFLTHETGIEVTREQFDGLVVGKSVQADVVGSVGHPSRKEQLGDHQAWYYDFTKIRTFGKNIDESTVFEFDGKGVLAKKYKTGNTSRTGNALLDAARGR